MAKAKKSSALARMVESIEVKNPDGSITSVPVSAEANSILNKILASQMRALISKSIEKFGNLAMMTPKELKELTDAARNVAEFSGEVYKSDDVLDAGTGEKMVEAPTDEVIDFRNLKTGQSPAKESPSQEGLEAK